MKSPEVAVDSNSTAHIPLSPPPASMVGKKQRTKSPAGGTAGPSTVADIKSAPVMLQVLKGGISGSNADTAAEKRKYEVRYQ